MPLRVIDKVVTHLYRRILNKHPMAPVVDLSGKTIIVTGAASGSIGYITARTLAAWGARVIITTRTAPHQVCEKMRLELKNQGITADIQSHALDLTQTASVQAFADWFQQHIGDKLDVLVNNAGVQLDILSEWKSPKLIDGQYEAHLRTNYMGAFQLTQALMPSLKNAAQTSHDSRVVNVVSHLHDKGINREFFEPAHTYSSWQAYGQSKLAMVHHALEIERRYGTQDHVHGYAVHPGSIYTNIAHHGLEGHPILQSLKRLFAFAEKMVLLTPEQGAQTQILCASNPDTAGGHYYAQCAIATPSEDARDEQVSAALWEQTLAWVKTIE